MMSILALFLPTATAVEGPAMGSEPEPQQLVLRAEIAGRVFAILPESGVSRGFSLPRSRVGARFMGPHGASARLVMVGTRSGGANGYIGIEGEAFVPRFQIAEARWESAELGLSLAAGIVDDIWVGMHQFEWGHPEMAEAPVRAANLLDRSDLGGWVSWTSRERRFSASVSVMSGEGEVRRERNNGLDVAVMVTGRPVVSDDLTVTLRLYGREGSRGAVQARNHRLGGSGRVDHRLVSASAMAMAGWGDNRADGTLEPLLVAGYVRTAMDLPVVGYARFDYALADRSDGDTSTQTVRLGGGPRLPLKGGAPFWLTAGWEGQRNGPAAGPVAGIPTGSDQVFLQLSTDLRATLPMEK